MKKIILIGTCLLGLSMGCQKNDDAPPIEITLQNEPPLGFDLIEVPDDAIEVDVTPTLSWESAKNPKGATVSYDIYLDTKVNPVMLLENDITDTSLALSDRLNLLTDYYWKVVAKDTDGRTSQSSVHNFTTRNLNIPGEALTEDAQFSPRSGHTLTAFDDQLWLIGGFDGDWKNDIWNSDDGIKWAEIIPTTPFPERKGHTTTVFKGKIWVIGGYDGNDAELPFNDVWFSSNGIDWQLATSSASFPERENHTTIVFDDKLWVIAGDDDNLKKNDVWFSNNGTDWEMATDAASFSKRNHHASLVFDNKIWVFGGVTSGFGKENDAWYSADGMNWTKANTTSPYSVRSGQTCTVFGNKIWMLGGLHDGLGTEAMYSSDGVSWEAAAIPETISKRGFHAATVSNKKLWVIGGNKGGPGWKNDVWSLD